MGLWSTAEQQGRQLALIEAAGLPQALAGLDAAAVLSCLQGDKKVRDGQVRFVLPTAHRQRGDPRRRDGARTIAALSAPTIRPPRSSLPGPFPGW
jgi:3-dehydroquinate synthetase